MPLSNCCNLCLGKLGDSVSFVKCDGCLKDICEKCHGLSATEFRTIELKKRTLKYFCPACDIIVMTAIKPTVDQSHSNTGKDQNVIQDIIKAQLCELEGSIKTSIDGAKEQILNNIQVITNSNLDMVKLLSGKKDVAHDRVPNKNVQQTARPSKMQINSESINPPMISTESLSSSALYANHQPNSNRGKFKQDLIKEIIGTDSDVEFSGVDRMKYIHLNNITPGVQPNQVTKYIIGKHNLNKTDITVQPLVSNDIYCSFKVGVRESLLDRMLNPDSWPKKVTVREFTYQTPYPRRKRDRAHATTAFLGPATSH